MKTMLIRLMNDEAGFIVSSELVLISTIAVLAMIVGLSEVAHGVNQELEDVGSAFGRINQSFYVAGAHGHKACVDGSSFHDQADYCDGENDIVCDRSPRNEGNSYYYY
ncbi:MAG: branched-chain amino acid aminotransferase [Planctomycetaceae bacterium]|nr:branched-chain amino acid aminotransferase [Planctomycetaceae bacterium]MCA9019708.1 branched-chain amino acid aminotransferase [Planctomycetaceae bacterium]